MRLIILPTCVSSPCSIFKASSGLIAMSALCSAAATDCVYYNIQLLQSLSQNISNCQALLGLRKFRPNYPRVAFILQDWTGGRLCDKPSGERLSRLVIQRYNYTKLFHMRWSQLQIWGWTSGLTTNEIFIIMCQIWPWQPGTACCDSLLECLQPGCCGHHLRPDGPRTACSHSLSTLQLGVTVNQNRARWQQQISWQRQLESRIRVCSKYIGGSSWSETVILLPLQPAHHHQTL